jgi:hypothetical protein
MNLISIGNKFINLDNVLWIETKTDEISEHEIVHVRFDSKLPLVLRGKEAITLLNALENIAQPIRPKKKKYRITDKVLGSVTQMSFKEIQERGLTLGEYQDALSKSEFGR